jgi:threonine/homoserine/homoserine lactone efflux protein
VNTSTSFASVVIWAAFGSVIAPYLVSERSRKVFNYSMAVMLVLSLIPVFWK